MTKRNKFYLTKEGLENLKKEYEGLVKLKKAKAKTGSPPALHSEELNPEFASFREGLDLLRSRIEELEYILKHYELIKPPPNKERNKVNLGAHVVVETEGQADEFVIVGTLEANPGAGKISDESPIGKALLNHKVGDEIFINSPIKIGYKIKKIRYK